jgi:hypothetical protein
MLFFNRFSHLVGARQEDVDGGWSGGLSRTVLIVTGTKLHKRLK